MRGNICWQLSYDMARRETGMYFPNARRLTATEAREYFRKNVKPRLPDPKGRPNSGEATILGSLTSNSRALRMLARNIRVTVMRAF